MKTNEKPFLRAFKTVLALAGAVVGIIALFFLCDFMYEKEQFAFPLWISANALLYIFLLMTNDKELVIYVLFFLVNALGWVIGALICWIAGLKILICTPILFGMVLILLFFVLSGFYPACVSLKKNYKRWYHEGVIKNWLQWLAGLLTGIIVVGILVYAFYFFI